MKPVSHQYQNNKKEKMLGTITLININSKLPNKILANRIETYMRKIIHYNQADFILEIQRWFNIYKLINVINHLTQ